MGVSGYSQEEKIYVTFKTSYQDSLGQQGYTMIEQRLWTIKQSGARNDSLIKACQQTEEHKKGKGNETRSEKSQEDLRLI